MPLKTPDRMDETIRGVIFFGDSIFAGTGSSDRQYGCTKILKDLIAVPCSIRSRNRDTSVMGLSRIDKEVLNQHDYSHILILFGNNDCWMDKSKKSCVSLNTFEYSLREMVALIRKNGQVPLLCNLQPLDNDKFFQTFPDYIPFKTSMNLDPYAWQKNYSDSIESISRNLGVDLVDIRSELILNGISSVISSDGIHPNNSGHKIIAKKVISALMRLVQGKVSKK